MPDKIFVFIIYKEKFQLENEVCADNRHGLVICYIQGGKLPIFITWIQ